MPPLSEPYSQIIRPCSPLEASPAGYLAYTRISSSRRKGLHWSRPSKATPLPLSSLVLAPEDDLSDIGYATNEAMSTIAIGMASQQQALWGRSSGVREYQMRDVLSGLGKHSWDLESYLDGVPISDIRKVIATSGLPLPLSSTSPEIDTFVLALAKWFKSDYMKWIDPVPCPTCKGKTRASGSTDPTPAERSEGGGRVELHQCEQPGCGETRRFVRYGKIGPLLRTREGRCGEWAHLFYAFLRVAGVEARYIWNSEDHVWAEFWSPKKEHWVHVDPCEAAVDKPLLYDRGWGKMQAYCLAFGPKGAEDVTAVYVTDEAACLKGRRARRWRESILALALEQHTISLQLHCPSSEIESWDKMMQKQYEWKSDVKRRLAEAEAELLGGRVSGPEEWRKQRDEMGGDSIPRLQYTTKREIHNLKDSSVYLFGNSIRSGSSVILTMANSQTSGVFADVRIPQTRSMRSTVKFRMFAPPGAGEADGMAVVLSQDRKLGLGGYGLGYSGLGVKGDFAVEIDTYRTEDHADDPPAPHISVHSPPHAHHRHSIACTKPGQIPFLSDGRVWTLELIYDGSNRRLVSWLKSKDETSAHGEVDEIGLFDLVIPVGEGIAGDWYVGVTASCGGLWQRQEVLEWSMEEVDLGSSGTNTEQI